MLAVLGDLPGDPERWAFEFKWDGIRAIAACDERGTRLFGRRGTEVTAAYPELSGLAAAVACPAVLDGEVVALDGTGRPSFTRLQHRLGVADPAAAATRARTAPVVYLAFDVLERDGVATVDRPYEERRELLTALGLSGERWQVPPSHVGIGEDVLAAATRLGLEGVVAKRLGSVYEPGRRSRNWVKVKVLVEEPFVVGGWLPGEGVRAGRIGSLLLGQHDPGGRLVYCGSVGTGLRDAELAALAALLAPLRRETSPFEVGDPRPGGTWVDPQVVVDVAYQERTPAGIVRHPRYRGRREDVDPRAVRADTSH